jgi:signal transduction histidine kinase
MPSPPLAANIDADMIRRALVNVIANAVRETPGGGTVRLAAAHEGDRLRLSVSDTGPGVAPELREKLFEPFVTGHADGTGLGLAIARELVAAHGGTLTLRPSARGAVFEMELPCRSS